MFPYGKVNFYDFKLIVRSDIPDFIEYLAWQHHAPPLPVRLDQFAEAVNGAELLQALSSCSAQTILAM